MTFTDAHVTTSLCGPSRASILTGQYAHHTGVLDNFGPHSFPAFKERRTTSASGCIGAGYETALVGKYLNAYTDPYGASRDPAGLGRLAGDGQHPDGGVLQLLDQRQRAPRPLRQQALGLLDQRPHPQGRPVHPGRAPPVLPLLRAGGAAPAGDPGPARPGQAREPRSDPLACLQPAQHRQGAVALLAQGHAHAAAQLYINHVRIRQEESLLALDRSVGASCRRSRPATS